MKKRIDEILNRISDAAARRGIDGNDITLVAVSKTFSADDIFEVYRCGLRVFGESRLQEANEKIKTLSNLNDIKFHMIGHIQTNKLKLVGSNFSLIHSVDSIYLADKMNRYFESIGKVQEILIQVNLVNEPQKHGVSVNEIDGLINSLIDKNNIILRGLMFIPPFYDDPEKNRINFRNMNKLFENIKVKYKFLKDFNILSMGMSDDFEIAIEEGSNMVRIGTAIFGRR
ncbi:MAG: YggS family pyridoxal phosphate-dependent enzyme [Calditerrivibrio sp.]|nr:YggS family pyridoxal phosphate-dependent enzyme [Calditerrivibrio sp.]